MSLKELLAVQKRIFGYIWPYWKVATLAVFFTVFVSLARLSQAKFIGWLFELLKPEDKKPPVAEPKAIDPLRDIFGDINFDFTVVDREAPIWSLKVIIFSYLLLLFARGISSFCQKYFTEQAAQSAIRDLRSNAFSHLQDLSMSFFESTRIGEIQSRCTADIIAATLSYANLADFLKNSIVVLGAIGYMIYFDWRLTLLVFLVAPVIGVAVGKYGKKIGFETNKLQSRIADLSAIIVENTGSQKVIKAYHRESFEIERFERVNKENFRTQMKLVQVTATQSPVVECISVIGIIAIVYFGASQVIKGHASLDGMVVYWGLMAMIIQPVTAVSTFYSRFQAYAAAGKRVFSLLDLEPGVAEKPDAKVLPPIIGNIKISDLQFSYDEEKEVLRGIDLEVQAGEVVAIVGTNGAGKSSFVNLIPRFYDPTGGSIKIDDHDIKDVTIGSLRTQIGIVIQESVLFQGTIASNIACGCPDYSMEEIVKAATLANAHEFISKLPKLYETEIGERGVRLSGGQRQRIAIARALLRDPKILILDEFTSGIDTESENLITEAIERIMKGRTSLVIAHRLNTIRHADRIIVLDAGKIVEEGTHEKLLDNNGLYTKLYEAQLRSPLGSDEPARKGA